MSTSFINLFLGKPSSSHWIIDMISSMMGRELWTTTCVSSVKEAVGVIRSTGAKLNNVAANEESGSKYERALATCMQNRTASMWCSDGWQTNINLLVYGCHALFWSRSALEGLSALDDITTKEAQVRLQNTWGPEHQDHTLWQTSAWHVPAPRRAHPIDHLSRTVVPCTVQSIEFWSAIGTEQGLPCQGLASTQ